MQINSGLLARNKRFQTKQRRLTAGLVFLGVVYALSLFLVVDTAIRFNQKDTLDLNASKAEVVASLVANDLKLERAEYQRMLAMSFPDLLADQKHQEMEDKVRSSIEGSAIKYVYLISRLPDRQIKYQVDADEAETFGAEPGTPLDYIYLLDFVVSDEARLEDTDGQWYVDKDRYTNMDEEFVRTYDAGRRSHQIVNDRWGRYIVGYAPVHSIEGDYLGLLGVDLFLDSYDASLLRFHMIIGDFLVFNFVTVAITIALLRYSISIRRKAFEQEQLLIHDSLTMCLSRRGLMQAISNVCDLAAGNLLDDTAYLLIIDVDHFKEYNDYYGHIKGDDALRKIAHELKQLAREADGLVGRYGGDEFMMIIHNLSSSSIYEFAEDVLQQIRKLEIEHARSPISPFNSVSIGVASLDPGESLSANELIQKADEALYRAKRNGRNQASA